MRRVVGGEASAMNHTVFVGQPQKVGQTGSMILKQGMDKVPTLEETGAFDGPWDEPEEGDKEHPSEVQDLHRGLSIATTAAEELGLDDMAAEIVQFQAELEEQFPGSEDEYYGRGSSSEESDLGQIIGDELSNVEVTPRDDPGRMRREGPV